MRTLLVGDIHGCYEELQELLVAARIQASDRIISVGDLADRGPESPQVLEFFLERPNSQVIMGNHEWKHVRGDLDDVPSCSKCTEWSWWKPSLFSSWGNIPQKR